jgi:hypothetical protein
MMRLLLGSGKTANSRGKVRGGSLMEIGTQAIGLKADFRDMVSITHRMRPIRETILQTEKMARAKRCFTNQTQSMKEFSKMVCSMASENNISHLVTTTLVSFKKGCVTEKALSSLQMVMSMKVIGIKMSRLEMEY